MTSVEETDAASQSRVDSIEQSGRMRRIAIYATVLLGVFLLGLVPMWMTARERERERDTAQAVLQVSNLQNTLATATIDARRGEYESARQAVSEFFTNLRTEIERGRDSGFNQAQQDNLRSMLAVRDTTITLLARSDPASADRLVELYNMYRQATGEKAAAQ